MKRAYNLAAWDAMVGDAGKQAGARRIRPAARRRLQRKAAYQLAANTGHINRGWYRRHR